MACMDYEYIWFIRIRRKDGKVTILMDACDINIPIKHIITIAEREARRRNGKVEKISIFRKEEELYL